MRDNGFLLGPSFGLLWDTADDPFDPKQGKVVSLVAEQAGTIWGGDFSYFKVTLEGKKYQRIAAETVLAARLKIGIADTLDESQDFPLWERFYSGGERGVRGYGRRRLGPISAANDPLGGLSLVEGSIELRRPLWNELTGALFVDFGQVSLDSFDPPFDDLKFSLGAGIAYTTPLGPLRLDIGFPIDPPTGDQAWQIHFSIGQFF
ncbi:MAG: BamA/TamA family outer membrane protein [Gammaproteobacteria bacterium]